MRHHWRVENNLHWVLDVAFDQNGSRVRKDNDPGNVAMLRHVALNLLKTDTSKKSSISAKRKKTGWSADSLCHVQGLPNTYTPRLPSKGPRAAPKS